MYSGYFLSTKISPPKLREDLIPRSRLLKLLDEGLKGKFILISAPAGFGKTSLAANWINYLQLPVSWVSLDAYDNDAAVFYSYLLHALENILPDIDPSNFPLLHEQNQADFRSLANYLISKIYTFEKDILLVLDDYHLIENQVVHENLDYLITNSPPNFHLLIITRADPPIRLSQLRLQKEIMEIRIDNLRLNFQESKSILNLYEKVALPEAQFSELHRRMEGWVAGLHLAAISMKSTINYQVLIKKFNGAEKFIIDYFLEEVLVGLPPETREFLISTSILNQFSADLCDAVLGINNSLAHIQYLEKNNIFIFPLGDQQDYWYRYHHLFRDLLRIHLDQRGAETIKGLHRKAAAWMLKQDFKQLAIDHLIEAESFDQAVAEITELVDSLIKQSQFATIERWVQRIPASHIESSPELRLHLLWTQLIRNYDHTYISQALAKIESASPTAAGTIDAFRSFLAMSEGDFIQSGEYARSALVKLKDKNNYFYQTALWCAGIAQAIKMDLIAAAGLMQELQDISLASGNKMFSVMAACQIAKIHHRLGSLEKAKKKYNEALKIATDRSGNILPIGGEVLMGLGDLYREQDDLEKAVDYLLDGIEITYLWRDVAAMEGYMSLAKVRQAEGNFPEAHHALDRALVLAEKYDAIDFDDQMVKTLKARVYFVQGKMEEVHAWAEESGYSSWNPDTIDQDKDVLNILLSRELVFYSRCLIEIGDLTTALKWIDLQVVKFQEINKTDVLIELFLYRALANHFLGSKEQVVFDLNQVIRLSENAGFRRLFYDMDQAVIQLLRTYQKDVSFPHFLNAVLKEEIEEQTAIPQPQQELLEPLSDRELDVLRYLQTNLTTPEIAQEMTIGVNTVRTHIKNIYQKLGVHKRSAAVGLARSKNLLSY